MTLALNIILMAFVFTVVVGALGATILGSRPARPPRPVHSAARQPAAGERARGRVSIGRAEA